eukprot:TRINITY_DN66629_c1_g4_i2.p1 TRINITY_DN66629_c1_g4~~TRINITY_DN66629_c1_g4_i2.p1  ORF type:complete len:123 (-),score=4.86 TRINITY_DN66629_c1_g4_i2:269-637(-)
MLNICMLGLLVLIGLTVADWEDAWAFIDKSGKVLNTGKWAMNCTRVAKGTYCLGTRRAKIGKYAPITATVQAQDVHTTYTVVANSGMWPNPCTKEYGGAMVTTLLLDDPEDLDFSVRVSFEE